MMCYTFTFKILNSSVQYSYLYVVLFVFKLLVSRYTSIQLYDRLGFCQNGLLTLAVHYFEALMFRAIVSFKDI